jgi:hypothetical protein
VRLAQVEFHLLVLVVHLVFKVLQAHKVLQVQAEQVVL